MIPRSETRAATIRVPNGGEVERPAPIRFNVGRYRAKLENKTSALRKLATRYGIQTSHIDMNGKGQPASTQTLEYLLEHWGVYDCSDKGIHEALFLHERHRRQRLLPPAAVAWNGNAITLPLWFPTQAHGARAQVVISKEACNSVVKNWDTTLAASGNARAGKWGYAQTQLKIPSLPYGYYNLTVHMADRTARSFIISAPIHSWQPAGQSKAWGAFLPMYALNSRRNWGAGNFTDWTRLGEWVARCGGRVMATLPLTAVFLDRNRCVESPYSPASRLFWNEFYVDIEQVPEFAANKRARELANTSFELQARSASKRASLIDYAKQMTHRRRILEVLANDFFKSNARRKQAFERFAQTHPLVWDYARFRAAAEERSKSWHDWEPRLRFGKVTADDFSPAAANYHAYAQFVAQEQIDRLGRDFRKLGLQNYLDLPVGVHPDSFDVWHNQPVFVPNVSVGAPSDVFFTLGQNWRFPPLHPQRVREDRYSYVIDYLRFQMRHAGILRIDHVMGLHRLYWIPPGLPASQGAYVRYPAEEWHAIFNLESHLNKCRLVGENLGIVPSEVNESMSKHRLAEMFILQFEGRADSSKTFRPPPKASVASINTHDTPTWAAYWHGKDIDERVALGILGARTVDAERKNREKLKKTVREFFIRKGLLAPDARDSDAILNACLQWLAASDAETVLINLEDLWAEELPQNIPGTSCERPNWRRKALLGLESIVASARITARLRHLMARRHKPPH